MISEEDLALCLNLFTFFPFLGNLQKKYQKLSLIMSSNPGAVSVFLGEGAFNQAYRYESSVLKVAKNKLSLISAPKRACRVASQVSPSLHPELARVSILGKESLAWKMDFVEGQHASDLSKVLEVLRIYKCTGRVLLDATVLGNILTRSDGSTITIDTDLAMARRGSDVSDQYLTSNGMVDRDSAHEGWRQYFWEAKDQFTRLNFPLTFPLLDFLYIEELLLGDLSQDLSAGERCSIIVRGILRFLPCICLSRLSPSDQLKASELISFLILEERPFYFCKILKFLKDESSSLDRDLLSIMVRDLKTNLLRDFPREFSLAAVSNNPYRGEIYSALINVIPELKNPEIPEGFIIEKSILSAFFSAALIEPKQNQYSAYALNDRDFQIFKTVLQEKILKLLIRGSSFEVEKGLRTLREKVECLFINAFFLEIHLKEELNLLWEWVNRLTSITHGLGSFSAIESTACPPGEVIELGHRYFQERLKNSALEEFSDILRKYRIILKDFAKLTEEELKDEIQTLGKSFFDEKRAVVGIEALDCLPGVLQTYYDYLLIYLSDDLGTKSADLFTEICAYVTSLFAEFNRSGRITFDIFLKMLRQYQEFLTTYFNEDFPCTNAVFLIFRTRFIGFLHDLIGEFGIQEKACLLQKVLEETKDALSKGVLSIEALLFLFYEMEQILSKGEWWRFGSSKPSDFTKHERDLRLFRIIFGEVFNLKLIPQEDILSKKPEDIRKRCVTAYPPSSLVFKGCEEIRQSLVTPVPTPYRSPSSTSIVGAAGDPSPYPPSPPTAMP